MIKLFAWESYTLKNVEKYRDQELYELRKLRFLYALLGASNEIIPIIAKVVVITIYVMKFSSFVRPNANLILSPQILVSKEQFRGKYIL